MLSGRNARSKARGDRLEIALHLMYPDRMDASFGCADRSMTCSRQQALGVRTGMGTSVSPSGASPRTRARAGRRACRECLGYAPSPPSACAGAMISAVAGTSGPIGFLISVSGDIAGGSRQVAGQLYHELLARVADDDRDRCRGPRRRQCSQKYDDHHGMAILPPSRLTRPCMARLGTAGLPSCAARDAAVDVRRGRRACTERCATTLEPPATRAVTIHAPQRSPHRACSRPVQRHRADLRHLRRCRCAADRADHGPWRRR